MDEEAVLSGTRERALNGGFFVLFLLLLSFFQLGCRHPFLQARRPREVIARKQVHGSGYPRGRTRGITSGTNGPTPRLQGWPLREALLPALRCLGPSELAARGDPGPAFWDPRPVLRPPTVPSLRQELRTKPPVPASNPSHSRAGAEPEEALDGSPPFERRVSSLGLWRSPDLYGLDAGGCMAGKKGGAGPPGRAAICVFGTPYWPFSRVHLAALLEDRWELPSS